MDRPDDPAAPSRCRNGHLVNGPGDVYTRPGGTLRECRRCKRERTAEIYARTFAPPPGPSPDALRARIAQLEHALTLEKRRTELAQESERRAWKLAASWTGPRAR